MSFFSRLCVQLMRRFEGEFPSALAAIMQFVRPFRKNWIASCKDKKAKPKKAMMNIKLSSL